jgi:hypothetical protein
MAAETTDYRIGAAQLLPFLLLVFGLAWSIFALFVLATDWVVATFGELSGSHPLFILAVYTPAIAALLLVGSGAGLAGIRGFLSRLFLWRASLWWYAFLIVGFPVISFAGAALKGNTMSAPMFTEPLGALMSAIGFMLILDLLRRSAGVDSPCRSCSAASCRSGRDSSLA